MRAFVTGGAGFIGSNLVERILERGDSVVVFDNFSTGRQQFLEKASAHPNFALIQGDTLDTQQLATAMRGCDFVFHLAANADVRFGTHHPSRDLQQNTVATFNVLEAMRVNDISRIAFSSTGSVYGESEVFPTPESAPFPIQTSLYGASKLAGEGMIEAFCEGYGFQAFIFRFVSILGERYSHGHVFDFYGKLRRNPSELHVLGNGHQRKSYLYVQDCIDAILIAVAEARGKVNVLNLGTDDSCEVNDSIGWITEHLGIDPVLTYTGEVRGWVGDSPLILLDTTRIRSMGWNPTVSIKEGIIKTLDYLRANPWLFGAQQ